MIAQRLAFFAILFLCAAPDVFAGLPYSQAVCESMGFTWGYGPVSGDPNAVELQCFVPTPDNLPKTFAISFALGLGAGLVVGGIASVLSSLKDMLNGF